MVGLERSLEVIPLARPEGNAGPSKADYRCLMRKPFTSCIEPTYDSGLLVPPEVQVAVGLDKIRAGHLRCILYCTEAKLYAIIPWRVDVMPPLTVALDSTSRILPKAQRSTPFRYLVEYCTIEWQHDGQQQSVVGSIHRVSARVPLRAIVHGTFLCFAGQDSTWTHCQCACTVKFYHHVDVGWHPHITQYVPCMARAGVSP